MLLTDTERINWLEKNDGCGLISDDAGRWAVSTKMSKYGRGKSLAIANKKVGNCSLIEPWG